MKISTKEFLNNLENKTSITFDWSNLQPTEKYVQQNNQAVERDTMTVNDGKLIMMVCSCGCNKCKEILGFDIFYGLGDSELPDAKKVVRQIKEVAPSIPVNIMNLFDLSTIEKPITE